MPFDNTPEAQAAKRAWIEALRSGNFEQDTEVLWRPFTQREGTLNDGYCCLGILCVVSGDEDWRASYSSFGTSYLAREHSFGLTINEMERLACLNDGNLNPNHNPKGKKLSFSEIADLIEKEF